MILIADSGSTKTHWVLKTDEHTTEVFTLGFNPYFQDSATIAETLSRELLPNLPLNIHPDIYYYGAGCSTPSKCNIVSEALRKIFPSSGIHVDHDLLAAARALCGRTPGIAGILGTGSNSCAYDGQKITENVYSLGFILGDEGSGAHLGKSLLRLFLYDELPSEMHEAFKQKYPHSREWFLDKLYKEPMPSRFLASFASFLADFKEHEITVNLVSNCFSDFFRWQASKYADFGKVPFHCVGSVGYHYKDILAKVAKEKGSQLGLVLKSPMEGLLRFHAEA